MYRITSGTTHKLPDVADFIETLNALDAHTTVLEARNLFAPQTDVFVARAPGRLDVMGGIADYSGSLVLQRPILEATFAAVQRDATINERTLKIISLADERKRAAHFQMSLADFERDGQVITYEAARRYFQRDPARRWAAYAAGVFPVLMRERDVSFREGARILISSRVPAGKGVSSSAALEVAVMTAVAAAFEVSLEARETALLCQKVENLVVGAPCGVMDQMTSACGEANRLLALLCQPAEIQGTIEVPKEFAFWGLDSDVRHAVTGADYAAVRAGAFMGYRIIAEAADFKVTQTQAGQPVQVDDPRWMNYLSNITPSEFEQTYVRHLPERIKGAQFLARYQNTTDAVTRVAPEREYAVRVPTAHAVYEHHRVRLYAELLKAAAARRIDAISELLGELMYQSHASYSACGLGTTATDRLVELVREAGTPRGLYGAKITGGGSGGTVAVLGRRDADAEVRAVAKKYAEETGRRCHVFSGSSPGSAAFGHLRLKSV